MSRPSTPSSTNKPAGSRSHRDDVLQFLDNLDSYQGTPPPSAGAGSGSASSKNASSSAKSSTSAAVAGDKEDPQSVLDFLDEIVTSRERRAPAAATATSVSGTASKRNTVASTSSAGGLPRSGSRSTLRDSTSSGRGSYLTPRESTTPTPAAASPSSNATAATGTSTAAQAAEKLEAAPLPETASASASTSGGGGWGWGSVWSQATNIVQQAKTVAEEQVSKNLPKNLPQLPVSPSTASAQGAAALSTATDRAQAWRSGALSFLSDNLSNLDIEKLRKDITDTGFKALKDVMDAVAPPIAQHEVIQVNLSHDMAGYEGVETLVYRSLAKIMEQVPGGDLVVNKGLSEDVPNHEKGARSSFDETAVLNNPEGTAQDDDRNLNLVEGFAEAYKLADANLEAMIKKTYKPPTSDVNESEKPKAHARTTSITVPVTICPVYMRIQPVLAPLPFPSSSSSSSSAPSDASTSEEKHLYFILLLRDPTNSLVHRTLTQSMPKAWLDIPFEENEWVEDIMVDVIRRGVEILGEEYVKGRMSGRLFKAGVNPLDADSEKDKEVLFEEKDSEDSERESIEMVSASAGVPT